jgi:penicillin-binding protein 1B
MQNARATRWLARLRQVGREARRHARWWKPASIAAVIGVLGALAGLTIWAELTAAALDLGATRQARMVLAAGRPLRPGVAVQAVANSLDRLGYREVSGTPASPGEFRRMDGRWEIHLRARPDLARSPMRVRLELKGSRIVRMTSVPGGTELSTAELEPELLTGMGEGLERRRPLPLAEMSRFLPAAVLAAEDHRFQSHGGLDAVSVARAFVTNAARGEILQGGSTVTQQLVKNLILGPERTWARKIREGALALAVERRYPKAEILEAYLNTVYLGQHGRAAIHGVGAAARSYWGKEASHLGAAESAQLAGMIRAPNRYSPVEHPERAQQRRDDVLRRMHDLGLIDVATLAAALAERTDVQRGTAGPSEAPYFLDYVRASTTTGNGADPGAIRIYTTLDWSLQRAAEAAVARGLERLERGASPPLRRTSPGGPVQVALVALDPASGAVRALVGGRDYARSAFNRATRARRQPGSAFKPFVFLAALRRGPNGEPPAATPVSLVEDMPVTLETPQEAWEPRNFEDRFEGVVSVRRALEQSSNAVTVRLAQTVGLPSVIRTARDVGITSTLAPVPALALGSFEVTPLELAAAYATLANGGRPVVPHAARGPNGEGAPPPGPARVSAEEAYLLTHLLQGVVERGTAAEVRARGVGGAVAGKTGTTNDTRDAWFVGYSPRLVAVVWVGFDDGAPLGLTGARAALPIWAEFMRAAAALEDPGEFRVPPAMAVRQVCGAGPELFLPLTEPQEPCAAADGSARPALAPPRPLPVSPRSPWTKAPSER